MKRVGLERIILEARLWIEGWFKMQEQGTGVTNLTPPANYIHVYAKDRAGTSWLHFKDDTNGEHPVADADATHAVLSATHSDTTAATVVRGDVLTGQAVTPRWKRLAVGTINQVLATDATDVAWTSLDHGTHLTGLADDDHTQYPLLAGRATGQVLTGGTASGDDLTLRSTSNATKGDILLADTGGNVIIGGGTTASRLRLLEASGSGAHYTELVAQPQAANITYTLPPDDGDAGEQLQTDGNGGLTWEASTVNHNLLDGSLHGDTVAQAVSRGSLIYGNSTPKWDELTIGTAGKFLRADGTDVAWSTLVLPNAATANDIVYASAGNTYGESANLQFDGTDFLLGSGIRARMNGQNRFRYLNSMCSVYRSTNQSINDSTFTAIQFTDESFDTDALHDTVTDNSRVTVTIAGKYLIIGTLFWGGSATGSRFAVIRKNGVATDLLTSGIAGTDPGLPHTVSGVLTLAAGDYVELYAWQNSGGALNITASGESVALAVVYMGE